MVWYDQELMAADVSRLRINIAEITHSVLPIFSMSQLNISMILSEE